jgi:hypothetical protein
LRQRGFNSGYAHGQHLQYQPFEPDFTPSGGTGAVGITPNTKAGCDWTAVSNSSFITITSGASGFANGNVIYSITPNNTSNQRTGCITIAGQTFTVTQDGSTTTPKTIQFSAANYSVAENSGSAAVNVTRSGDSYGPATVDYLVSDNNSNIPCDTFNGAASQKCDYIITAGTLRFAPGETTKSFNILIVDDAYVEGNETLPLKLINATGATPGAQSTATLTIKDNDFLSPSTNPIDNAQFFVREHYLDFLNREPDPDGLGY